MQGNLLAQPTTPPRDRRNAAKLPKKTHSSAVPRLDHVMSGHISGLINTRSGCRAFLLEKRALEFWRDSRLATAVAGDAIALPRPDHAPRPARHSPGASYQASGDLQDEMHETRRECHARRRVPAHPGRGDCPPCGLAQGSIRAGSYRNGRPVISPTMPCPIPAVTSLPSGDHARSGRNGAADRTPQRSASVHRAARRTPYRCYRAGSTAGLVSATYRSPDVTNIKRLSSASPSAA